MLETHRESGADATVAVMPVAAEQTSAFGILKMDNTGPHRALRREAAARAAPGLELRAARPAEPGYLASMGIYIFKREVAGAGASRTRSWSTSGAT